MRLCGTNFFLLFSGIVTTWRTDRNETPLGAVGVAAVVAASLSPPLSNTYAPPRAGFTMVSLTSSNVYRVEWRLFFAFCSFLSFRRARDEKEIISQHGDKNWFYFCRKHVYFLAKFSRIDDYAITRTYVNGLIELITTSIILIFYMKRVNYFKLLLVTSDSSIHFTSQ